MRGCRAFAALEAAIDDVDGEPEAVLPVGSYVRRCQLVLADDHVVDRWNPRARRVPEPE